MIFSNEILFFTGFTIFVVSMLLLDLGIFSKKDHIVKFKEAAGWSAIWVMCALVFYVILDNYAEYIHGIDSYEKLEVVVERFMPDEVKLYPDDFERSLQNYRNNVSLEFITGYLLEYSLSVDNIFVIILIFTSFGVREKYYKKVLFWGVLGAIVMRFIFIFIGAVMIARFHWIIYLFGIFLMYTGFKMLFSGDDKEEKIEPEKHPVVRFASRYFHVFPRFVGNHFFIKRAGKWFVTPLFLVVLIIEFTDLIFAVDSVPAVFAVTSDPYIVFFSNIFAIMGLRSMFFFLSNIVHIFRYLKLGLSFLLVFIGFKMLAHDWLKGIGFENVYSLYAILGILGVSIIASLLFPGKGNDNNNLPGPDDNLEEVQKELARRMG